LLREDRTTVEEPALVGVAIAGEVFVVGRPGVNPGELQVTVTGAEPEYEVRLLGELDMSTAAQLREELLRLASDGATMVTVDLSELAFVDSTGLSVLITGLKRLRQQGGDLVLRSPSPGTRRVLEITGLTEVFPIS
jgi:anti-sigma B factor antagonist